MDFTSDRAGEKIIAGLVKQVGDNMAREYGLPGPSDYEAAGFDVPTPMTDPDAVAALAPRGVAAVEALEKVLPGGVKPSDILRRMRAASG